MSRTIYYKMITLDELADFKLQIKHIQNTVPYSSCNSEVTKLHDQCRRILEKVRFGNYVILDVDRIQSGVFVNTLVRNFSVWNQHPDKYDSVKSVDKVEGFPNVISPPYDIVVYQLNKIFSKTQNSKDNGKSENQLQGQSDPQRGDYEGCILYGGGDKPQLTAGRHCHQARTQKARSGNPGAQIIVPSRSPNILGAYGQKGSHGERIEAYCRASDGTWVLSNGITTRLVDSREKCERIGDTYVALDGSVFTLMKISPSGAFTFTMIDKLN